MEINQIASAGTLESSDIMITIQPNEGASIDLTLESSVENQFGRRIREVILETLNKAGVTSAKVEAKDRGALDCTIMARTITAVHRAVKDNNHDYDWKEIDTWNV